MTAREASRRRAIARKLVAWFDPRRRPMEWRETKDPYRVWVSEIMLQQTTVRAVVPYYRKFVKAFPTVARLARAPLDRVLSFWEGLGYYARARNLHRAAAIVVERHDGRLPEEAAALAALPGIGRSTAGAIAALAFGRDEPILDANAKRVIARLEGIRSDLSAAPAQKSLWEASRALVLPGKGRETALAMMDLGNLVCRPADPRCTACPVARHCEAHRAGIEAAIPLRRRRGPLPHHDVVVAVIGGPGETVLIDRRDERGFLGGLWEFPGGRRERGETLAAALLREVREELGLDVEIVGKIGVVRHSYSHYRVTIHAYRCRRRKGRVRLARPWRWVPVADLRRFAFPASNRKIVARLRAS